MDNGISYESLGVDRRQLRLIRLLSAPTADQPLECALETFDRVTSPEYVALSYTWGTEESNAAVKINSKLCQISPTIDLALREICRRDPSATHIWIDQVCINQHDAEEKNHQVLQMRHIYSDASSVIAWLGPAFENCDILFTHLRRVGNGVLNRDWDGLELLHDNERHMKKINAAYDLLCQRSYWKRLWILQEFSIASNVTIMCGPSALTYDLLLAVQQVAAKVYEENDKSPGGVRELLLQRLYANYVSPSRSFLDSVVTRRARFRNMDYEGDSFFQVLTTCLTLERDYNVPQTSDARDRVFSLLYLAADVNEIKGILDYTKTCEEVYYDTALALLKQGNVDVLSYCQFPKETAGLPTWAPDWCMAVRSPCNMSPWFSKFSASGDSNEKQKLEEVSRGRLSIKGFSVDTVKKFGKVWNPNWEEPLDREAALAFIDDIKKLCELSPRVRAHEELLDAVRIATSDGAQYGEEDLSGQLITGYIGEFIWAYDRLLKLGNNPGVDGEEQGEDDEEQEEDGEEQEEDGEKQEENSGEQEEDDNEAQEDDQTPSDNDWLVCAIHYLHSRRPFLTKTGFLGLGPSHMKEGDEVCIFYGGKTPYMVRPNKDGDGYTLVGEAFVYGLMHGEALRGDVQSSTYILQ